MKILLPFDPKICQNIFLTRSDFETINISFFRWNGTWVLFSTTNLQLYRVVQNKQTNKQTKYWQFWTPFSFRFLNSFVKLLLKSLKNDVANISFMKIVLKILILFLNYSYLKKSKWIFLCPRVYQWTLCNKVVKAIKLAKILVRKSQIGNKNGSMWTLGCNIDNRANCSIIYGCNDDIVNQLDYLWINFRYWRGLFTVSSIGHFKSVKTCMLSGQHWE